MNSIVQRTIVVICLLFAIAYLSSCGRGRARNYSFYYRISATNDTLDNMTRVWHEALNRATKDRNFTPLASYRLMLGQFITRSRSIIGDMKVSAAAKPISDSELAFLLTRATVASEVYTKFEQLNELTPYGEISTQLRSLDKDLASEIAGTTAIKRALKIFAVKNGLQIGPQPPVVKKK